MNRKETTEFLNKLLENKLYKSGHRWAKEVVLDYGSVNVRRVDYMEFAPNRTFYPSDLEKGMFVSYEVKSCKEDFYSGFGRNFDTEKGYFVMPMTLYKEVINEIPHQIGVLVPVPDSKDKYDEFESPTPFVEKHDWSLKTIRYPEITGRKRSMVELLYNMLRTYR